MFATVSVDKMSFPSGHATRAVALAAFFTYLYPLPLIVCVAVGVWAAAVAVSRVLLGRHHVLDVVGGVAVGVVDAVLVSLFYIGEETAARLLREYFHGDDPWSAG